MKKDHGVGMATSLQGIVRTVEFRWPRGIRGSRRLMRRAGRLGSRGRVATAAGREA